MLEKAWEAGRRKSRFCSALRTCHNSLCPAVCVRSECTLAQSGKWGPVCAMWVCFCFSDDYGSPPPLLVFDKPPTQISSASTLKPRRIHPRYSGSATTVLPQAARILLHLSCRRKNSNCKASLRVKSNHWCRSFHALFVESQRVCGVVILHPPYEIDHSPISCKITLLPKEGPFYSSSFCAGTAERE